MDIDKRFNELMCFAATEATISLSKFLNKTMKVEVMDIMVISKGAKKEVALFPQDDQEVIMSTKLIGMIEGTGAFILPTESALRLCDVLLQRKNGTSVHLGEIEQSALLETGNIIIGSFLNALGYVSTLTDILHKKLKLTISSSNTLDDGNVKEELIVRTTFHVKNEDEEGQLQSVDIEGLCVFFFNSTNVLAQLGYSRALNQKNISGGAPA